MVADPIQEGRGGLGDELVRRQDRRLSVRHARGSRVVGKEEPAKHRGVPPGPEHVQVGALDRVLEARGVLDGREVRVYGADTLQEPVVGPW